GGLGLADVVAVGEGAIDDDGGVDDSGVVTAESIGTGDVAVVLKSLVVEPLADGFDEVQAANAHTPASATATADARTQLLARVTGRSAGRSSTAGCSPSAQGATGVAATSASMRCSR